MTDKIVAELKANADLAAMAAKRINTDTPECRMAYARGVRAMAELIQACANVADGMRDKQEGNGLAQAMLQGYAESLKRLVRAADDLIPPGYEL